MSQLENYAIANINKICVCQRMVKECNWEQEPGEWDCECCCKTYSEDVKIYYWCGKETCQYKQITGNDFEVCSECFNTLDNSNDEHKNFLFAKITAMINIIS